MHRALIGCLLCCLCLHTLLQSLRDDKDAVEAEIASLAATAAKDLGLILDKTIKLEWHKVGCMDPLCVQQEPSGCRIHHCWLLWLASAVLSKVTLDACLPLYFM
jgi:hypothetical protein